MAIYVKVNNSIFTVKVILRSKPRECKILCCVKIELKIEVDLPYSQLS